MAQKILFTFSAQDVGVAKTQETIRDRQKAINDQIKEAKRLGSPYDALLGEQVKLRRESTALREEQAKLNREFKATTVPKDSLAGLRLEYSKLTDQVTKLSAAERNSKFGRSIITNAAGVKRQIDSIEQSLGRFTGNVGNYKSAFSAVGGLLGGAGVAIGGGEIINAVRSYDKLFATLRQSIGNDQGAKTIFADIKAFAKETPFQLDEVTGAFIKLQNRGFSPTVEQLRTFGDIAATQFKTIDQFTEAVLDAQTGEFERLKEFGIVARKNGDDIRVTFKGQSETFKNTADNITGYLLKLGQMPGVAGAASAVSQTLDGTLSNLVDNFQQLFASIGSGGGALKSFFDGINDIVGSVNDFLDTPLSQELQQQQADFTAMLSVVQDVTTSESERNRVISTLKEQYPQYLKFVNDDTNGQIDLAKTMAFGNSLFEQRILLQSTEEQRTALTKEKIKLENELTKALIDGDKARRAAGATSGIVRNDAGDIRQTENIGTQAERRINSLRESLQKTQGALADLQQTANETALRTTGKTLSEIEGEINKIFEGGDKQKTSTPGGGALKALAGSIAAIEEEIKTLEGRINKTPSSSGIMPSLITQLDEAKKKLDKAKSAFLELQFFTRTGRKLAPSAPDTAEAPTIGFVPELLTEDNKKSAKDQADQLRKEVEARMQAVEFPIEIKIDAASQKALDEMEKQVEEGAKRDKERRDKASDERIEKEKRTLEVLTATAISSAETAASAAFNISENRRNAEQNAALAALEVRQQKEIDAANGNADQEKLIREKYEKEKAAIERKFAQQRKAAAIKEALINTALAITKALTGAPFPANLILAGGAAIAGAVQVAEIKSQEFWQGGQVKRLASGRIRERQNAPRTAHGDTVLAYVKPGEMLLTEEQQSNVMEMAGHDVFHRAGVPGIASKMPVPHFATGGVVGYVPQTSFSSSTLNVSAVASFSDEQVTAIGRIVANEVSKAVGSEVRSGIGNGLNDANRRIEREGIMNQNRLG